MNKSMKLLIIVSLIYLITFPVHSYKEDKINWKKVGNVWGKRSSNKVVMPSNNILGHESLDFPLTALQDDQFSEEIGSLISAYIEELNQLRLFISRLNTFKDLSYNPRNKVHQLATFKMISPVTRKKFEKYFDNYFM